MNCLLYPYSMSILSQKANQWNVYQKIPTYDFSLVVSTRCVSSHLYPERMFISIDNTCC